MIATVTLATLAIALHVWRRFPRRSIQRAALLFVAVAYLPVAGFLPTQHWTADSYFYLPLVGVTVAFATIVARRWTNLAGFAFVALALAVVSFVQVRTWSGAVAMFGPSSEIAWGPWRNPYRVVTSAHPCRPCGLDGCGGSKVSECLTTLAVDRVHGACVELLAETAR